MQQKIIILSSTNLSANPRALKEVKYATKHFKEVIFVGFDIDAWTIETEKQIKKELPENIQLHYISATRSPFLPWFFSSLSEKISYYLSFLFPKNISINSMASNKRSYLLHRFLNKNIQLVKNANLIVAHTLGSLFPAYKIAQKLSIPFAFDVEDFHPGEFIEKHRHKEEKRRIFLMRAILPKAKYISYPSPFIGKYTLDLLEKPLKHQLINNSFPLAEIDAPYTKLKLDKNAVNLVWYSQHISPDRGLEFVLPFLEQFPDMQLYLIGNMNKSFAKEFQLLNNNQIHYLGVMKQGELNASLKYFDVGLALEFGKDLNNKLALSNKIITYYQAGLYIFSFKTKAQQQFIDNFAEGICIYNKETDIKNALTSILKNKISIKNGKAERYEKAKQIAWEKEVKKLDNLWLN